MDRREVLKRSAILLGGILSPLTFEILVSGCSSSSGTKSANGFTAVHEAILAELAEIIIPTTEIPGAKAAGVGPFIVMMVNECYPEHVRDEFLIGLNELENKTQQAYHTSFSEIGTEERIKLVEELRQSAIQDKKKKNDLGRFFKVARDLTILGYLTSEIGVTQLCAYIPVPGRYDGCTDFKPGQKRWAS